MYAATSRRMNERTELKDVARRYYEEIFQRRNLDALDQIISPDFTRLLRQFRRIHAE